MELIALKAQGRRAKGDRFNVPDDQAPLYVHLGVAEYADVHTKQMTPAAPGKRGRKKKGYNRADMAGQLETK